MIRCKNHADLKFTKIVCVCVCASVCVGVYVTMCVPVCMHVFVPILTNETCEIQNLEK